MTAITIIGNLTADPDLRFVGNGAAVANFTIAHTPRKYDKATSEWKDGEPLFMRCSLWREAAENAAGSLTRGMRVIATGTLEARSYDKDGEKKTVTELRVDEIGPSLKYATANVVKTPRGGSHASSSGAAASANTGDKDSWGGSNDDSPPF